MAPTRAPSKSDPQREERPMMTPRIQAAGVRAMNSYQTVTRLANKLAEELDDVTPVHGVPVNDLDEEDSMVVSIVAAKEAHQKG